MGSGILNVAVSGLNAAQVAIQTASHNIANASTDGYNRQTIVQTTNTPNFSGQGFIGSGTNVSTVKRVYSDFLNNQVLSAQTNVAQLQSYSDQISQIDNLLADPDAGLSPGLDGFFSALQQLSSSPSSVPARQAVISAAQALAGRFNSLDQQLSALREGVNTQINTEVSSINSLVTQVADLNQRIILAQAAGTGQPANDLIDQRDSVIAQLNKEVRISKQVETDGTYSIFFGNGQPLVAGSQVYSLMAKPSPEDMSEIQVALKSPSGQDIQLPESLIDGGKLGGLLQFRSQTLNTAQNQLGRVATALVTTFNAQHRLGQDLTGQLGGDFFKPISPQVLGAPTNIGTGLVSASIPVSDYQVDYSAGGYTITRLSDNTSLGTFSQLPQTVEGIKISLATGQPAVGDRFIVSPANDPGRRVAAYGTNTGSATLDSTASNIQSLTDSDYRLTFTNGGVSLTRLSDNQVWTASGQSQAANLQTLMANAGPQGFILGISGTAQAGDSYLIRPTRSAAGNVKLQVSDVNNIAAAMPIRTVAKATNAGQGTISVGSVSSSTIGISAKVKLTYDAAANALVGFPVGAKVTVGTTVYAVSSASQRIPFAAGATISFQGANFQISNTPANGDTFVVGPDMVTTGNSANPMVKADYLPGNTATGNTLTFDGATQTLSGFPIGAKVTLTDFATPPNTLATITIVGPTTQVPQPPITLPTTGVSVNYLGVSVRISGQLANGQQITPGGFLVQTPQSLPVADIPLTFRQASATLPSRVTGFPVGTTVTVTQVDGTIKSYPMDPTVAGADYVPYTPGATIAFNGLSFQMGGTPADGDQFTISRNASGSGDNRNLLSLNALQTAHTMLGGSGSYQSSYAQLVSGIGNKARELAVTQTAQQNLVTQTETSIESISGVNLDEEAANLLRYQQAYQASAKVIDISQKLFDLLANLG